MKKVFLIIAAALVVTGLLVAACAVFFTHFDFQGFSTAGYETSVYDISDEFDKIAVSTRTSDVILKESENGKVSAVCVEKSGEKHSVSVKDGTLNILFQNDQAAEKLFGNFELFPKKRSVTVFLPAGALESLEIVCTTGDVNVPGGFSFEKAGITGTTGDVYFSANVTGTLAVNTTTGDITLKDLSAGTVDLSVSTGRIKCENVDCGGAVTANVSTGDTTLKNLKCGSFRSTGGTGDITLKNTVVSESLNIERGTGDVTFERSDANDITVKTTTGDVKGSLLSDKIFITKTSTGSVKVPDTSTGGECRITTGTGSIRITISKD